MLLKLMLLQSIFYNLNQTNLNDLLVFHCSAQQILSGWLLMRKSILKHSPTYLQFVDLLHDHDQSLDELHLHFLPYRQRKIAVFVDLDCQGEFPSIDYDLQCKANDLEYFGPSYHWLVHGREYSNVKQLRTLFGNFRLSVDTDLTAVSTNMPAKTNTTAWPRFIFYDVYNNGYELGGRVNVTSEYEVVCRWDGCQLLGYLSDLHKRSVHGNREVLTDITFRVAAVVTGYDSNKPSEEIRGFLLAEKDFHIDPIARLGYRILNLLLEYLNAKAVYEYYDRWTDDEYNGGAVGALVNRSAELSSVPMIMSLERSKFLQPIIPTGSMHTVCMFRTSQADKLQIQVFVQPFNRNVWLTFCLMLFLSLLMLSLMFALDKCKAGEQQKPAASILSTTLLILSTACMQGSHTIPRLSSGRLLIIFLSLMCFVMYNFYTSVVVSKLLAAPKTTPLKTLGDLADSADMDIGLQALPYFFNFLNFSKLPEVRRLVRNKILIREQPESVWYSVQQGIEKMRYQRNFVYIFESATGYYLIERLYEPHEICDLHQIAFRPDNLLVTHLHYNSPYKEIIRLRLLRILETGIHSKHRRLWVHTHLNCFKTNHLVSVGWEYSGTLFICLFAVYIASFLIFIVEVSLFPYKSKSK